MFSKLEFKTLVVMVAPPQRRCKILHQFAKEKKLLWMGKGWDFDP
jgi:hypothetical protein